MKKSCALILLITIISMLVLSSCSLFERKAIYADSYQAVIENYINWYRETLQAEPENLAFNMIYVDGDEIPELVIKADQATMGLYSYADGQVYSLIESKAFDETTRLYGYSYISKGNRVRAYDSYSRGAEVYNWYYMVGADHVLINDLSMSLVHRASSEPYLVEDEYGEMVEVFNTIPHYYINDAEVGEANYNAAMPTGDFRSIEAKCDYDEIMDYLNRGKVPPMSQYEIVLQDCSWEEAEKICKKMGGHLATLDSDSELLYVMRMINNSEDPYGSYYVGAHFDNELEDYVWNGSNIPVTSMNSYIDEEEWSIASVGFPGLIVKGNYAAIVCYENEAGERNYRVTDIPDDITFYLNHSTGHVGFICEIEK